MPAETTPIRPFKVDLAERELHRACAGELNDDKMAERRDEVSDGLARACGSRCVQELRGYWGRIRLARRASAKNERSTELHEPRSTGRDIHFIHVRYQHPGRAADDRHTLVGPWLDHRAS